MEYPERTQSHRPKTLRHFGYLRLFCGCMSDGKSVPKKKLNETSSPRLAIKLADVILALAHVT